MEKQKKMQAALVMMVMQVGWEDYEVWGFGAGTGACHLHPHANRSNRIKGCQPFSGETFANVWDLDFIGDPTGSFKIFHF